MTVIQMRIAHARLAILVLVGFGASVETLSMNHKKLVAKTPTRSIGNHERRDPAFAHMMNRIGSRLEADGYETNNLRNSPVDVVDALAEKARAAFRKNPDQVIDLSLMGDIVKIMQAAPNASWKQNVLRGAGLHAALLLSEGDLLEEDQSHLPRALKEWQAKDRKARQQEEVAAKKKKHDAAAELINSMAVNPQKAEAVKRKRDSEDVALISKVGLDEDGGLESEYQMSSSSSDWSEEDVRPARGEKRKRVPKKKKLEHALKCHHAPCEKSFSRLSVLTTHIRSVHEKIKPFVCSEEAVTQFPSNVDAQKHRAALEKIMFCASAYGAKHHLLDHLFSHLAQEQNIYRYLCGCGHGSANQANYNRHTKVCGKTKRVNKKMRIE